MIDWKFKTSSCRPIGLDIGHSSIKMIQLAIDGENVTVVAADKVRFDPDLSDDRQARRDFVIAAIKRMLAQGSFRGREVVSCLPADKVKMASLRLPEAEDDRIEQTLRKEVSHRFGLDPAKDSAQYLIAGSVRQGEDIKNELILFAVDDRTIKDHIEMIEAASLIPVAIDTVACALFRSYARLLRRQEDKQRTVVFVDVGDTFTTVVFGRAGQISFIKQIPLGAESFNRQIASKLEIGANEAQMLRSRLRREMLDSGPDSQTAPEAVSLDEATRQVILDSISSVSEELAKEISLCLRYYTVTFRGKRALNAVFSGGGAYEDILLDILRQRLAIEVEVAQPLRGFDMAKVNLDSDGHNFNCEWAVAVGLSLKGQDSTEDSEQEPAVQIQQAQ